jgi:hydroxypyruvate isomerase
MRIPTKVFTCGAKARPAGTMLAMTKLAANLTFLWPEKPFLERFAAARAAGFSAVEVLFPYEASDAVLAELVTAHELQMVLINAPAGDWAAGERGLAALDGRQTEFRQGFLKALGTAEALDVPQIHVMAGLCSANDAKAREVYLSSLVWAADQAYAAGRGITIEPLNGRDVPGYFLNTMPMGEAIVREVAHPALKLQFDFYHQQILHGDVYRSLERAIDVVGHVQIAGVPDRHEPSTGELAHDRLLARLDQLGYTGWVGCEYKPSGTKTEDGLAWAEPYLAA